MLGLLESRGPDGRGYHLNGRVGLASTRLKIIDLSDSSAQPMVDKELGLVVVFNGCIYNYRELRVVLIRLGYKFRTTGDTEVVLKAWHAWGADCARRLTGMFAFCVLDTKTSKIALVRDRLGVKPLYFAKTRFGLYFSSTLTSLLACPGVPREIDRTSLHFVLALHGIVPGSKTLLAGIERVPPATVRIINEDLGYTDITYWKLASPSRHRRAKLTPMEWRDRVLEALFTATRRRLVGDVQAGAFLSGGLDSSLLVALMASMSDRPVKTFSIGFEDAGSDKGDEFYYSDALSSHLGTDHQKAVVSSDDLAASIEATIAAMSEPMPSHDNIGFFLLSKIAAEHVKVVLSGQGADEIFAGYHWYPAMAGARTHVKAYQRAFFDRDLRRRNRQLCRRWRADQDDVLSFVDERFGACGPCGGVNKALNLDTTVMLVEDPVKRVDNMTMAAGLEGRLPFLDHELIELVAEIPVELKLAQGGKGILKDAARLLLPEPFVGRPKGYFPVPVLKKLGGAPLQLVKDTLSSRAAIERGLFEPDYVRSLLASPGSAITPLGGAELWQIAVYEMWFQVNGI